MTPIILQAADLHLDSPMKGLRAYEGAPIDALRGATRRATENLVDLALEEEVALVLLAGDLYDGDWTDFHTGQFLRRQLHRLVDAGIPVVLISGNHDAASKITRSLRWPDGITALDTGRPQSKRFDDLGVVVHGQGYARPATVTNLVSSYPAPLPDYFNIGLLHTCLTNVEHERYAPCTLEELLALGYDYWALGHVHTREVVHEDPYVVFPGNVQGRHMRECGEKGATLVTIGDVVTIEHRALDVARFAIVSIDVTTATDESELYTKAQEALLDELDRIDGRLLAVRLRLTGSCVFQNQLLRSPERIEAELQSLACEIADEQIWLERVAIETSGAVTQHDRKRDRIAEEVSGAFAELYGAEGIAELQREFEPLAVKLRGVSRGDDGGFDPTDAEQLRRYIDQAERELLPRLLESEA